jgi:hypothetical protein
MSLEPFETAEAHARPNVRQISTFLDNRVGQLLALTKALEGTDIRILSLTILSSVDCAIVRLLVDDPDQAGQTLSEAGFAVSMSELLVVEMPPGRTALLTICSALLAAEVNIHYAYPLLDPPGDNPALALLVDDIEVSASLLRGKNFTVLDESDFETY